MSEKIFNKLPINSNFDIITLYEAINSLVAGFSHDLNNALTIITGYNQLAQQITDQGTEINLILGEMNKGIESAEKVIKQMKVLIHGNSVNDEILDLNAIIKSNFKMLSRLLSDEIKLKLNLMNNLPTCLGDPNQIKRILILSFIILKSMNINRTGSKKEIELITDKRYLEKNSKDFLIPYKEEDYILVSLKYDSEISENPNISNLENNKILTILKKTIQSIGGTIQIIKNNNSKDEFNVFIPT